MSIINQKKEKHKRNFLKFLKQNHIYERFIFNFKKYNIYFKRSEQMNFSKFISTCLPSSYIDSAFSWRRTAEGFEYWNCINSEYMKELYYDNNM